jgi:hypothetical protein
MNIGDRVVPTAEYASRTGSGKRGLHRAKWVGIITSTMPQSANSVRVHWDHRGTPETFPLRHLVVIGGRDAAPEAADGGAR